MFISLTALPQSSPYHSEAALTFACRTSNPSPPSPSLSLPPVASASSSRISVDSDTTLTDGQRDSAVNHSYPPTPPSSAVSPRLQPLSTSEVEAKLHKLALSASSPSSPHPSPNPSSTLSPTAARLRPMSQLISSAQITHFLLTPHQHQTQQQQQPAAVPRSFFSRIAEALRNHAPSARSSFSFNMCAIPPPHRCTPTSPANRHSVPIPTSPASPGSPGVLAPNPHPYPLVTFHDTTPVFTVGNTTGLLEVDEKGIQALGVDLSFYITIALSYLEFLEEREVRHQLVCPIRKLP